MPAYNAVHITVNHKHSINIQPVHTSKLTYTVGGFSASASASSVLLSPSAVVQLSSPSFDVLKKVWHIYTYIVCHLPFMGEKFGIGSLTSIGSDSSELHVEEALKFACVQCCTYNCRS